MILHDFLNKMARIFILILSVSACDRTSPDSQPLTLHMKHKEAKFSRLSADQEDGHVFFLEECTEEWTEQGCVPPALSSVKRRIAKDIYRQNLATLMGVDSRFQKFSNLGMFDSEISGVSQSIKSGDLDPEERSKAQDYLAMIEGNRQRAKLVFDMVDDIAAKTIKSKDERYHNSFANLLTAFTNPAKSPKDRSPAVDINTGLAWAGRNDACWYDVMGKQRPVPCEKDGVSIPVQKSCNYGVWSVPSIGQVFTAYSIIEQDVKLRGEGLWRSWTKSGEYLAYVSDFGWKDLAVDKHKAQGRTLCVAIASELYPDQDLDGDGILNRLDKCNRTPGAEMEQVALGGPRIGCAPSQSTDAERGPTMVREWDPDEYTLYRDAHSSRYVHRATPDVPCTLSSGATGKQRFEGLTDPELVRADGITKGKWLYPSLSKWTKCE